MGYRVTPLRLDAHRGALARLWTEMSDERIASVVGDRMRWLYEQAPDGPTTTVLAVHEESGEVVGCGSFLQRPTWVDGHRVRAGVLCDFAVTRAHRVAGAALAIQRGLVDAARTSGVALLYGYPNDQSILVFKRIGYSVVGETTTWVKPLHSGYKLRDALRWKWAAPVAAAPVDVGLWALDRVRSARSPLEVRGEVVPRPDGRADALWERARGAYGVIGEQSSAYLDWRYRRFTTGENRMFGVSRGAPERLEGLAVYSVEHGKAFLRDLLAAPLEAAAEALLLALSDHLRGAGVDSISLTYIGSPAFGERLRRLGFVLRGEKRALVLHPDAVPEPLRARAFDPASWFMLDGELDI